MANEPHDSNPIDVHVGRQVAVYRKVAGLSQEALGDAIGVTFQQVQKYEKGTNRIGASPLYTIGHALDVPISVFFSGLQGGSDEPDPIPERLAREGIELQAAFCCIQDAGTRRHLVELARAIANHSSGSTGDRTR